VNAAYLLLTSAWLAGADAAPAAPAPVASAPVVASGSCCGTAGGCSSCADTCGCERTKFWDKCKAKFHKKDCGCESSCGCAAPAPTCGCEKAHHVHAAPSCGCAAPAPSCGCAHAAPTCGCEDHCKPKLWDRMKAKFHKDCGCETSCGGCSTCGGSSYGRPRCGPVGRDRPGPAEGWRGPEEDAHHPDDHERSRH